MKWDELKLRLECLKRNFRYREDYPKLKKFMDLSSGVHDIDKTVMTPRDFALKYGFNDPPFSQKIQEVFAVLDPYSEPPEESDILYNILRSEPVIPWDRKETPAHPKRYGWRKELEPYQRLFMVDLRARKKDIIADFEKRLTEIYQADQWKEDRSRYRKEAWTALSVWDLRKQRHSFRDIGLKIHISTDTAKHSFYRAYELTQIKRYEPELLKREAWVIQKEELKRTCDTCPLRDTCDTLCPDILAITDQDQAKQQEKLFDDPDYIDSLQFSDTF